MSNRADRDRKYQVRAQTDLSNEKSTSESTKKKTRYSQNKNRKKKHNNKQIRQRSGWPCSSH